PDWKARLPCTVIVPGEVPGAKMPPLLIVVAPTVPMPASVAPAFTVTAELAIDPFTTSVPALTAVAPEYVSVPVSVSVPVPILVSPPVPEIVPASVALLPLVSNVPPPALSVTARLVVKPDRNCKAPPPKARPPELLPRLLSAETATVPALIVVPPEYVLVP